MPTSSRATDQFRHIFWVEDDALDDPDLLPPPDEIAAEIVENLEAPLDRFRNMSP